MRNNLGFALLQLGRAEAARQELEAALAIRAELLGEESAEVAQTLRIMGLARLALGDHAEARSALDRSVELSRTVYAEGHPRLAEALGSRAELALAERHALTPMSLERLFVESMRKTAEANRVHWPLVLQAELIEEHIGHVGAEVLAGMHDAYVERCLLYTSDAADE